MSSPAHLSNWTGAKVAAECGKAYNAYRAAKTESYRAYSPAIPTYEPTTMRTRRTTSQPRCRTSGAGSLSCCQ